MNQSNKEFRSNSKKSRDAQSGSLTKLTDDLMVGRRVSKTELGPNKRVGEKSVVLVP
jgi:hypothetical protein